MDGTSVFTSEEINKLKVCGKSFIMTVSLLRVIEMMISFDRNVIIDQEGSLGRVFQVIVMCKTFLFFFFSAFFVFHLHNHFAFFSVDLSNTQSYTFFQFYVPTSNCVIVTTRGMCRSVYNSRGYRGFFTIDISRRNRRKR